MRSLQVRLCNNKTKHNTTLLLHLQDSPKGEQRPGKKGTRGLSYIIRQAAKLKAQRAQPYTRPSTGTTAAADAGPGARSMYAGPPGTYCPAPPAAAAAAPAGGYGRPAGQFTALGVPCMPQQQLLQQQQPQLLQMAGSNSSGSDSYSSIPFGSSPTYLSSGSSSSMGCQPHAQYSYTAQGVSMARTLNGVAAGPLQLQVPGSAAAAVAGSVPPARSMPQPLPPPWAPALDCSPGGMSASEGSSGAGQLCFTPGSATSNSLMPSFQAGLSAGMAQPYSSSCPALAMPAAAAALQPAQPAPHGAFGPQPPAGSLLPGSFATVGFAGSSYACAPEQQQAPMGGTPAEMQWQEPPEFAGGHSSSSSSHSSSGFGMFAHCSSSPSGSQQQYIPSCGLPAATAGACGQRLPVLLVAPHSLPFGFQAQPQQPQPQPQPHPQQQQVFKVPLPTASLQEQQQLKQQQHAAAAPTRSSGTGAGTAAAAPAVADDASAAVAAAAGDAAGSPMEALEGVVLMRLDDGDVDDLGDLAHLLDSDSSEEFDDEDSCPPPAPAPAAPAAPAGDGVGSFCGGQVPLGAAAPAPAVDCCLQAPSGPAAAGAAVATEVAAAPAEGTQPELALADSLCLDLLGSDMDAAAAAAADIDLEALLGSFSGEELCEEFEFSISGDELELLLSGSDW